jgi:hypothetical protein
MVVGGGFEPPKGCPSRFTVCPRWPLGYPTNLVKRGKLVSDLAFAKSFFEEIGNINIKEVKMLPVSDITGCRSL